jgi:hypothetical protein
MGLVAFARGLVRHWNDVGRVAVGIDNQSRLLNDKFEALLLGFDNQAQMLNSKLSQIETAAGEQLTLIQTLGATITDLQKAQLIMQREVADAIDEMTALIKVSMEEPAVAQPRPNGED